MWEARFFVGETFYERRKPVFVLGGLSTNVGNVFSLRGVFLQAWKACFFVGESFYKRGKPVFASGRLSTSVGDVFLLRACFLQT